MATEFVMPKLGLTMEEGTISEWLIPSGSSVTPGTPVLRIETDKTETDVEASEAGVLHHAGTPGQTFACGEVVGWFLGPDEAPPASAAAPASSGGGSTANSASAAPAGTATVVAPTPGATSPSGRMYASPNARRLAEERGIPLAAVRGTGPNGRIVSEDLDSWVPAATATSTAAGGWSASTASSATGGMVLATHAARQLADLLGVELAAVAPDPLLGRVSRDGVAAHVRSLLSQLSAPATASASVAAGTVSLAAALQEPTRVLPLKGMRGTIARRMHQSLTEMAQLTLFVDADMDNVIADRTERKAAGDAPGYTDYVIAAVARALEVHPVVNSQITDDGVALLPVAHVGMAVALDEGLIVPVIQNTRSHSLASLAAETSRLARVCREGSPALTDLEGGTFSVTAMGMFGVDGFTPVINPPNSAILGVGRLREDVILDGSGTATATSRITLSLTWDHRAFDGAPAAKFAKTVVDLLNDPAQLDSQQ